MRIESDRVYAVPMSIDHLLTACTPEEKPSQEEMADLRLEGVLDSKGRTPFTNYAIFLGETDEVIGTYRIEPPSGSLAEGSTDRPREITKGFSETSIIIYKPEHRASGFGTEIKKAILKQMVNPIINTTPNMIINGQVVTCPIPFLGLEGHINFANVPSLASNRKCEYLPFDLLDGNIFLVRYPRPEGDYALLDQLADTLVKQVLPLWKGKTIDDMLGDKAIQKATDETVSQFRTEHPEIEACFTKDKISTSHSKNPVCFQYGSSPSPQSQTSSPRVNENLLLTTERPKTAQP